MARAPIADGIKRAFTEIGYFRSISSHLDWSGPCPFRLTPPCF